MLMPSESVITEILRKYRIQERGMLRDPADPEIRARFQGTAYTLCVLMGQRTALEAVRLAESQLAMLRDRREQATAYGRTATTSSVPAHPAR